MWMNVMQREDAADGTVGKQNVRQQVTAEISRSEGKQKVAGTAEPTDRHRRILRTYGQKKAKADSAADNATATLSSDFLALIGGKR